MTFHVERKHLQEEERATFVIASVDSSSAIPSNARVVKSFSEAKGDLLRGEAYVEFRRFVGLTRTGSAPWVVTINDGDHQVVDSQHATLLKALQKASRVNAPDPVTSDKPESKISSLFRRLIGEKKYNAESWISDGPPKDSKEEYGL